MSAGLSFLLSLVTVVGTGLFFGVPVLLLANSVVLMRQRQSLPRSSVVTACLTLCLWSAAYVIYFRAAAIAPPQGYSAGWFSIGFMLTASLAGLALLLPRLSLPPYALRFGWVIVVCGLLLTADTAFNLHVAAEAYTIGQYNDFDEADVQAKLARNPNDAAARSSMANIDIMNLRWPDAVVQLQHLVVLEPDNEEAQFLLARAYVRTSKSDLASRMFQQMAERNDSWGQAARRNLAEMKHPRSR